MTPAIHVLGQQDREEQERIQRGRDATTFVTMPFWGELQAFGEKRIAQRLNALENAKHADAATTKALVDLWRMEAQVIRDFLKFPYAAIEAAGGGR
jgi:hypothetical protein